MVEYDVVVLIADLPQFGLSRGDVGTIVMDYRLLDSSAKDVEVEFMTRDGTTIAVETVPVEQLRLAQQADLDASH